ncbi:MAG: hypothetical protein ACO3MH_10155 [Ilumatobacteraceae bacterium]
MVAFVTSLIVTAVVVGGILAYQKRRPVDQVVTWGEAMVGSLVVFFLMFWVYGVVPHQWLTWADNELNWRVDKILYGPGEILKSQEDGGWSPIRINYIVVRDLIAVGIYIVALGGNIWMWSAWQKRGEQQADKPVERSQFGRPLVKEGAES